MKHIRHADAAATCDREIHLLHAEREACIEPEPEKEERGDHDAEQCLDGEWHSRIHPK